MMEEQAQTAAEEAEQARIDKLAGYPVGLRHEVMIGLEKMIWEPPAAGVSDFDRVEAVQLLGQFRDPVAGQALLRVLRDGPRRIRPPDLGRWLRDTALDTLLRTPAARRAATDAVLTRYYNFWERLAAGHLERNIIYDDIPLLVQHARGGLVLRAYILPLLSLLVGVLGIELALGSLGVLGSLTLNFFAGILYFGTLGLGLFNLHQAALVLLVAEAGKRLPLLTIPGRRRKALVAEVLAALAFVLTLYVAGRGLRLASGFREESLLEVGLWMLPLPLLVLPCYMLAHDLEVGSRDAPDEGGRAWSQRVASALRWVSGMLYIGYVLVAYTLVVLPLLSQSQIGTPSDVDVIVGMLPFLAYLFVAPVPVLAVLAALGWIERRLVPTPTPGGPS